MSLYNLIHGHNPLTPMLLAMLDLNPSDVPRYRDIWWDGEHINLHTRTGGGNREEYEAENDGLCAHPQYVSDADDDFDSTYADFKFKLPEKFEHLRAWLNDRTEKPAAERWQEAITKLQTAPADDPDVKRMLGVIEPVMQQVAEALKS